MKLLSRNEASGKNNALTRLRNEQNECSKCLAFGGNPHVVFGTGNPDASVMFVGEAPGFEEAKQGRPFVGRSGQLLTSLMEKIGLRRDDVYITNVVKCRPLRDPQHPERPGNDRPPTRHEIEACLPVLLREIAIVRPTLICTLGNTPTQALLHTAEGISSLRGIPVHYNASKVLPLYHPAALLHNPALRKTMEADFMKLRVMVLSLRTGRRMAGALR